MLIVHLFASYAHVNLCHFFSSSWCQGLAAASASRTRLRMKVTPDLDLTYSKSGGNLGLVLKMKTIA